MAKTLALSGDLAVLPACARRDPDTSPGLSEAIDGVRDWDRVLTLADRHRLVPLVARTLCQRADVPQDFSRRLLELARAQMCHSLMMGNRLVELCKLLRANGIEPIAYKGPTLAALAYGDASLRSSVDLDLIVRTERVQAANEVLVNAGFRPWHSFLPEQHHLLLDCVCEHEFASPDETYSVEIHWQVVTSEFGFKFPDQQAWSTLQSVRIGNEQVPTLSNEDLLLALAAHGTRHLWSRLIWVADTARLATLPGLDWGGLLARADRFRARRMLLLSLSLAHSTFGERLPAEIVKAMDADDVIPALAQEIRLSWHNPQEGPRTDAARHALLIRTRQTLLDKFRYARHILLTPQVGDFVGTDYTGGSVARSSFLRLRGVLRKLAH